MTTVVHPFPAHYDMELIASPVEGERAFHFPERASEPISGAISREQHPPSLLVRFRRPGHPDWTGVFHWGYSELADTCITTMPDPDHAGIVAWGRGTVVNVVDPGRSEAVAIGMVARVLPLAAQGLCLFVGTNGLCAYGKAGLCWETIDFMMDGIEIGDVVNGDLFVHGASIWSERDTVAVDLTTGKVRRVNA